MVKQPCPSDPTFGGHEIEIVKENFLLLMPAYPVGVGYLEFIGDFDSFFFNFIHYFLGDVQKLSKHVFSTESYFPNDTNLRLNGHKNVLQ